VRVMAAVAALVEIVAGLGSVQGQVPWDIAVDIGVERSPFVFGKIGVVFDPTEQVNFLPVRNVGLRVAPMKQIIDWHIITKGILRPHRADWPHLTDSFQIERFACIDNDGSLCGGVSVLLGVGGFLVSVVLFKRSGEALDIAMERGGHAWGATLLYGLGGLTGCGLAAGLAWVWIAMDAP